MGQNVKVSETAGGHFLRTRSFHCKTLKKKHNAAHLGIRAKGNNVCACNMAGSDGFHLTLDSRFGGKFFLFLNISLSAQKTM